MRAIGSSPALAARELSAFDATMLVMGGIVGVGIFFTPHQVAAEVPEPGHFLALWAVAGAVALCGALCFAELGASLPHAGGWYLYLREAFGRPVAFLFAWVVLFVVSTGATAVMISFFTDIVRSLFPALGPKGAGPTLALGAFAIVAISALTCAGLKLGAAFQNACMFVKLGAIGAIVVGAFLLADGPAPVAAEIAPRHGTLARGMVAAILPILFTCGGWQMVCYIAPAVRDPARTLPRAILVGVVGVVLVYLVTNAAYLRVLGIEGLARDPGFASTIAERTLGASGSRILRGAMAVSALGVCAVTIIATPWLYVAMAREGLFFGRFAALHPRTGAPVLALCVQAVLCLAYWVWGQSGEAAKAALPAGSAEAERIVTPDVLVSSVAFVEWIFHALVAIALFRLRATRPDLARPFRAWTIAPIVYLAFACAVVFGNLAQANVRDTAIGLALLAAGALVYWPWRKLVERAG